MNNKNSILKNKNVVTIGASIVIVLVLIIGYNYRVNSAISKIKVPYAKQTIEEKTEITEGMLEYMSIPKVALKGNIVTKMEEVIDPTGKVKMYSRVNTIIPQGSFIYKDAIVKQENLPDASLYQLEKGEKLNYITVNMLSTYSNSIKPGQYIDIYASLQYRNKNYVAKLFSNIKILAVKTSSGQNVFENENEKRTPYVIFFALPNEEDILLKKIHTINAWGGGTDDTGTVNITEINLKPVPTNASDVSSGEKLAVTITSDELKDKVDQIVEDITDYDIEYDNGSNPDDKDK